ncbi:MAG: hypothetical protein IJ608_03670 [Lachnospiraceae bacterium]|nr:hypothetical protein [Lachnospiraceae bacterium]
MKIVLNGCYGYYKLSDKAIKAYADRKGIWVRKADKLLGAYLTSESPDKWNDSDESKSKCFMDDDIQRDDIDLVAVVEELGPEADGFGAHLYIEEFDDGYAWDIDEYDGDETIRLYPKEAIVRELVSAGKVEELISYLKGADVLR